MKPIIQIQRVSKIFSTDRMDTYALKDINFNINQKDFVSIEGPSGSGKSTLLNILGLLTSMSKGSYLLQGKNVSILSERQKTIIRNQFIGFIFQDFNLINDLSVLKNVELPLLYRKGLNKETRIEKVKTVLAQVGLSHRMNHFPSQLSGGQQQRVAVARAIVGNPHVILADEPTGNLDTKNGEQVMQLLTELNNQGTTICMVTHDMRYRKLASRNLIICDGVLTEDMTLNL